MKRHHVVFVFLLIFGGYFAYTRFHHGDIDGVGAIRMGIAFPLFGAIAFFDGRLLPRLRIFVQAMMLLITWGVIDLQRFHKWEYKECNDTEYRVDFSRSPDVV